MTIEGKSRRIEGENRERKSVEASSDRNLWYRRDLRRF